MNILLTGATSFLGRAVTEELIGSGHAVYAFIRPDSKHAEGLPENPGFHRVDFDMGFPAAWNLKDLPPMDACIHLGWEGQGVKGRMDEGIQEQNVKNTLLLMQEAAGLSCRRFLFAGSQAEYGVTEERVKEGMFGGRPVNEEEACHPLSRYGKAKLRVLLEGSTLAEMLGMTYIHMRIFSVYGPGDHETSLVSSCIRAAVSGSGILLSPCTQMWNFLYVSDCARAIRGLLTCGFAPDAESGKTEEHVVNVGSRDSRPLREFVGEIFSEAEKTDKETGTEGPVFMERKAGPEGTPWLFPDCGKLEKLTGFQEKISFREGIGKCIAKKS